jgi:phosphatidylethanolamine-binding protein (PEBP) family uncharacterized protein
MIRRMRRKRTRKRLQRGGFEGITFPGTLLVSIGSTTASGQLLNISKTKSEPIVVWNKPPVGYYTLVCIDPNSTAKSWLHWLVINCGGDGPDSGSAIVKWEPPAPSPGTGIHNYHFFLFQHAYTIVMDPPARGYFDIHKYIGNNGLKPVSAASIRVQAPQSV